LAAVSLQLHRGWVPDSRLSEAGWELLASDIGIGRQDGPIKIVLMVSPLWATAQDGTAKWLRNLWVTIGSTGVTHSDLPQPSGFQGSHDHANCKAELALRVIQGRWKLLILRELLDGRRRFSDLQRALSGVSQKVLTAQLRELEADGVLQRTVYPEVPPRVEYDLTDLGRELMPVLDGLHAWGQRAAGSQQSL